MGRLGSGPRLVDQIGSGVRVSALQFSENTSQVGWLGPGTIPVGRLGSGVRVSGRLESRAIFVGWIGPGVRVSYRS